MAFQDQSAGSKGAVMMLNYTSKLWGAWGTPFSNGQVGLWLAVAVCGQALGCIAEHASGRLLQPSPPTPSRVLPTQQASVISIAIHPTTGMPWVAFKVGSRYHGSSCSGPPPPLIAA